MMTKEFLVFCQALAKNQTPWAQLQPSPNKFKDPRGLGPTTRKLLSMKGSDNKTQRVKLTQNGPPYLSVKVQVDSKRKDTK